MKNFLNEISFGLNRLLRFPPVSFLLLFVPATIAVFQANACADHLYDSVRSIFVTLLEWVNELPGPIADLLGGDYGVVSMLPFLFLYALPTILIFSLLITVYKSTGLLENLSYGLHPFLKPFGLAGSDLVRVVMGFGCNIPAVVATRACSGCSRGTCISAIAFGSACSYQLSSTLALFAAAELEWLAPVYMAVLAGTTLIYLRLRRPHFTRPGYPVAELPEPGRLRRPNWGIVIRETTQTMKEFIVMALPIFITICLISGALNWAGIFNLITHLLSPVMALFNLPSDAALSVALGSVRKDGIAIGLLDADWGTLKVALETPVQVLTIAFLAGVVLPCLVTVSTVVREMGTAFAFKMLAKQASFAVLCTLVIAWVGKLFML